ncbi:ABC transporter ATP-binding protein [Acidilobus saccharovorans]|uniref:ABC transporter ATP-binding protein n=1 Tax=Acidilobus saccharovorans TaxID=242703 RepID=UPI00069242BE|nr:ABC transporter ATP-binding protein [Acidilobus saccharovorans]
MKQRLILAMALMLNPRIVVMDEPTTGLDVVTQHDILRLIRRVQRQRDLTMVFISHDIATVGYITDRVYVMKEGRIVEEGPTEEVLTHPRHEYTRLLIESVPNPYSRIEA